MKKEPVERISFQAVVTTEGFSDAMGSAERVELNLLLWRIDRHGKTEVSEVHSLGYAYHRDELDALVKGLRQDIDRSHDLGREWFRNRDRRR